MYTKKWISFMWPIFIKCLLRTICCSRHLGCIRKQSMKIHALVVIRVAGVLRAELKMQGGIFVRRQWRRQCSQLATRWWPQTAEKAPGSWRTWAVGAASQMLPKPVGEPVPLSCELAVRCCAAVWRERLWNYHKKRVFWVFGLIPTDFYTYFVSSLLCLSNMQFNRRKI